MLYLYLSYLSVTLYWLPGLSYVTFLCFLLRLVSIYFCHIDHQCSTLAAVDNVKMSCYNGSTYTNGESYEGDTCSFTCDTGYELTGSDTRTCQKNGSWSGSEVMCRKGR